MGQKAANLVPLLQHGCAKSPEAVLTGVARKRSGDAKEVQMPLAWLTHLSTGCPNTSACWTHCYTKGPPALGVAALIHVVV